MENQSEILFYTADDGKTKLQVRLEDDTVWLNQQQIALLFDKSRVTITEHIKNLFSEEELEENLVCRNFRHTTQHGAIQGKTQDNTVKYYNLDVIISVGYRVKSQRGTQFRIWATQRLKEYIVKGFSLDDERLKQGGKKACYFQELLQRIRDIRSSERNFYQPAKLQSGGSKLSHHLGQFKILAMDGEMRLTNCKCTNFK